MISWTKIYANRRLSVGQGAYTLTGQIVGLLAGRKLSLAHGSYTLTGQDVSILARRLLALGYGIYTLTGQPVTFEVTEIISLPARPRKDRAPLRIGGGRVIDYRRRRAEDEEY